MTQGEHRPGMSASARGAALAAVALAIAGLGALGAMQTGGGPLGMATWNGVVVCAGPARLAVGDGPLRFSVDGEPCAVSALGVGFGSPENEADN